MTVSNTGPISADRLRLSPRLVSFIQRIEALVAREEELAAEIQELKREIEILGGAPAVKTYVIQAGENGLVKIGRARDVLARIRTLQTASPYPLRVLRVFHFDQEREMHRRFSQFRQHGEWFTFHPDMLTVTP